MGWLRSRAWVWALLIDTKHNGFIGRIEIEPTISRTFSTNIRSLLNLKESTLWGLKSKGEPTTQIPVIRRCGRPLWKPPQKLALLEGSFPQTRHFRSRRSEVTKDAMMKTLPCQSSWPPRSAASGATTRFDAIPSRALTVSHVNLIAIPGGLYSNVASDSLAQCSR
jgi:hypothetical protein